MKNMNKILTVSVIAMMAVSAANAKIVSESMLGTAGHYGTEEGQTTVQAEIGKKLDSTISTNKGGVLTTNASTGAVEVSSTIAQSKVSGLSTSLAAKQDAQIGAAADSGKAVIVGSDGKMTTSGSALGTAAYKNVTDSYSANGTDPVSGKAVASAISGITATANGAVQTDQTTTNKNKVMSTNSSGQVTASTITGSNGVSASVGDDGSVTVSGTAATSNAFGVVKTGTNITNSSGTISVANAASGTKGVVQLAADAQNSTQVNTTAENVSNKVTATSPTSTQKSSTSMYPSMATADAMATAAANTKQAKLSGTEGNVVLYGASAGSTGSMAVHKRDYNGNNATINAENAEIPTVAYARVVANEVAGDYVGIEQGSGNADKVLITDSSGDVGANLIADKHIASGAAIASSKLASGLVTGTAPIAVSRNSSTGVYTVSANVADSTKTGVVKGGGNVAIANDGTMSVDLSGKQDDLTVMSVSEGTTGTATTERSMDAAKLKQIVQGTNASSNPVDGLAANSYMTGYAKASSGDAVATTDTIKTAIGKLEKQIEGKQASGSYVTLSGTQTVSGNKTFSGTVAVTGTETVSGANTTAGKASDRTTAVAAVSDGNVASAITALDSKKEEYANKVTSIGSTSTDAQYPTAKAVYTAVNGKIDKTVSGDKNGVIVRNSAGTAMKGTGSDITVSDAGAITVGHATSADTASTASSVAWANVQNKPDASTSTKGIIQIASDSDVTTGTNTTKAVTPSQLATKQDKFSIPGTPSTAGNYVLTASVSGTAPNQTVSLYWEDIGR